MMISRANLDEAIEAVVSDVIEAYELALRGENIAPVTRKDIHQTVNDATGNNWDQLVAHFEMRAR